MNSDKNLSLVICKGCKLSHRETETKKIDFGHKGIHEFCWDCIVSINNSATRGEKWKVRKDNKRLIEALKEHTKCYNFMNYETLESLCTHIYEGFIK
ncbi:MAG: hypothetical protein I3273_03195 [Candidatus Moeniiplasma glomeromycotorum]|nr:hypothetical protein [Candidatus Moeniiplasma glomeromycotorum]MCE8167707.1 hypothetical protein [Candidatus Moeniiplasma glomeromycotorum]MCE8169107.1 hypothetical protein [Candidatus Moeniiplasma glomeromycotorum]